MSKARDNADAEYLTARGASKVTGLSGDLLKAEVHAGRLKAKRTGRDKDGNPTGLYLFRRRDLDAWYDALEDA